MQGSAPETFDRRQLLSLCRVGITFFARHPHGSLSPSDSLGSSQLLPIIWWDPRLPAESRP